MRKLLLIMLTCILLSGCVNTQIEPSQPETTIPTIPPTTRPGTTPTDPATTPSEETLPIVTLPPETIPPAIEPTQTQPPDTEPTLPPQTEPADPPTTPTQPPAEPEETEPADPLEAYLDSMSTAELVGQMFFARCPGKNAVSHIRKYHFGGYILFEQDFENQTPAGITQTIADYQSASQTPMLIAVDEEGGKVTRVSKYPAFRPTPFLSPRELYESGGLEAIKQTESEKSALLSSLGINVNLSPVCDIATDPAAFMYPRSLGQTPEITGSFVQTALSAMKQHNVGGVLKHFPGYGNNADTHIGIAVDERSLTQLESCDLVPFQMAIHSGCEAIMISHTIINAIDPELPATLSPKVIAYLRNSMGFNGVIVTDDLVMQAITDQYGPEEAAIAAVNAGNDLLISTQYKVQFQAVLDAVNQGRISHETIRAAVRRILLWKEAIGLMEF